MRRRLVALIVVVVAACSSPPALSASSSVSSVRGTAAASPSVAASPVPTSAPVAAGKPFGVLVDVAGASYSVLLIGTDGQIQARANATRPAVYSYTKTAAPSVPLVSISADRVYFADRASIRWLKPNGSSDVALPYPGGPQTVAGFAVSADNRRIAVSLLTFPSPDTVQPSIDLFVEDVGGANRVDLVTSSSVAEWPIAWNNGHVIVAVGPPLDITGKINPYHASRGYHVVDATTGNRLVTMSSDCIYGPLQPSGSACETSGQIGVQGFDGGRRIFYSGADRQTFLALNPDGGAAAGQAGGMNVVFFSSYTGEAQPMNHTGNPIGWIDEFRLVIFGPVGFDRAMLDMTAGSDPGLIPLPACASCPDAGAFFGTITSS